MVYTTVCNEREPQAVDFTPLRVDWFARYSSVGQTVGAFHRRDCRGDDAEILVARLIDRPIRPMIADGWQHETQILTWVLSYDKIHPSEALSICSASAALCISQVPMTKPIAGVEVGLVDGVLTVNPTKAQMANSTLQLIIAGTKEGILMIEGAADFLPEEIMIEALKLGHAAIGVICDGLSVFQSVAGKAKKIDTLRKLPTDLLNSMEKLFGAKLDVALQIGHKQTRGAAVAKVEKELTDRFCVQLPPSVEQLEAASKIDDNDNSPDREEVLAGKDGGEQLVEINKDEEVTVDNPVHGVDHIEEDEASELSLSSKVKAVRVQQAIVADSIAGYNYDPVDVKIARKKLLVRRLRSVIINTGKRSDARGVEEVRPISIYTSVLPGAHGSSLFTRGETQSLSTATLGSKAMEARYENLDELSTKKFYLQYRFPPSSVGEVGRVGGVNRREVGHGNLAERALIPCIPDVADFPYSIRAESLITESCGSSSMATVCGCCLAMLDAGVPLKSSVAGVAMGLILGETEGEEPVILTDILGLEDALGTMDFKVAGNETGITTFQLDIKSEGLTLETLERALLQARRGRLSILADMKASLSEPRRMKDTIPKILEFMVPSEALGKIIGPKGKTVQTMIEQYKLVNINLEDTGSVQIESYSYELNLEVKEVILKLVEENKGGGRGDRPDRAPKEKVELGPPPEVGIIYRDCEIKGVHNFGVFTEILPGYEGLVHVSELDTKKIPSPEAAGFVSGQKIDVKYLGKNDKGQMRLSRRACLLRDNTPAAAVRPVTGVDTGAAIAPNPISAAAEAAFSAPPPAPSA
eukprot:CAMPEP_0119046454 /NCGR_PEP_ID=MMETSP1177-20130426/46662_1 /TAXON_ID=2985 /ORGANISM="Ochromonas sp, Strain CCMP1899" /LENGTH=812 /DNA_ID=CAMNT_0007019621 /DNA_START=307 /DNA_END=2745 /DNA_ORIENTATION=+